jgi:glycosyltransferase involved in cell wall biosynthesis
MRIGMISQWYEPETGSAAHPTAIARGLQARGHQVRVLTGFPSYPQGRTYDGYRMRVRSHEMRDGIELLRVPDLPSHDQNAVRRALMLTSFAASATAQVRWLRGADVVLTYLSPATVGLAAWTLERLHSVPYVLYVQDLWPETITASGFLPGARTNAVAERVINVGLRRLYRRAAGTAALSPTMARTLGERGTVVEPVSIPNWVDEDVFAPVGRTASRKLPAGRTWIMYAGGMGEVQALDHAVRALARLSDRPDIGLVFVGDGVARGQLERLAVELGVTDRVLFLGSRPVSAMPRLIGEAAAQLVSLKDLPLFRGTIPSKVQASMACGSPIVCAVAGDAADVVERAGCGVVVAPEDPAALAGAFVTIADMGPEARRRMGAAGRRAYVEGFSAAAGTERLEELLERAARSAR